MEAFESFKERLIAEKNQLDERSEKLANFIISDEFNDIDGLQQKLLINQSQIMVQYQHILSLRIKHLEL